MKASKFSDAQKAFAIGQSQRSPSRAGPSFLPAHNRNVKGRLHWRFDIPTMPSSNKRESRRLSRPTALLFAVTASYTAIISKTLGSNASVIETPHVRHSNVCNSGNPPIFGIERTNRMAAAQLGQDGVGW
jgi:hypothetical protein